MITILVLLLVVVGIFAFQQYTEHNNLLDKILKVRKELVSKEEILQSTFGTVDWYRTRLEDSGREVMRLHKELESIEVESKKEYAVLKNELEATKYQLALSKTAANRQYEEMVGVKQNLAAYEVSK